MHELTVAGHTPKVEYRDDWAPAYGDELQRVKRPWLVCDCGWDQELGSSRDPGAENIARLEHFAVVLDSLHCPDCQPGRYCPKHCPRQRHHQNGQNQFCPSCGLELSGR